MFFLKISNANIAFGKRTLTWKSYTTNKALPTTKQVQLVDPKEFVIAALDADSETFIMHVVIREQKEIAMDPDKKAQIEAQSGAKSKTQIEDKAQVKVLLFDKSPTEVLAEYSDYSNIFLAKNVAKLPENTKMNEHAIKLEKDKQPPFGLIYSLGPVELETLKTYIKTNLANGFILPFNSSAGALIFFDRKSDRSLRLYMDYRGFNNITTKNRYPLSLIGKSFDWLGWAKRFTQLDLTNVYHRMRICEGDK